MRSSLLLDRGERTFVVVFDKDDEVIEGLTSFATLIDLGTGSQAA